VSPSIVLPLQAPDAPNMLVPTREPAPTYLLVPIREPAPRYMLVATVTGVELATDVLALPLALVAM
jgi:hypothetical protein